ncbi:hypothetical protein [Pseudomonas sp. BF-B-28]|uniref:hypothetical protein n=1 Tax=Pseudomonas sp. BF-B-28 TaxID=2832353 RepID=UPI001CC07C29|nr:hypothetical protein [Pseudomonas sp. BF-B-28]
MKKAKAHGFRKAQIELEHCLTCRGKAVVQGVFHELVCIDCNGSGWVMAGSRLVLSTDELVTQLSLKLQQAQREIVMLKQGSLKSGSSAYYQQNNRRGAGGSNYTGD